MARTRTPEPELKPPNGFLASAVRLPTPSRNMAGRAEGWQTDAWNYWETVGELRYVSTWLGNVMSRARLTAGKREGRMIIPVTDGPAAEAMDSLYGGPQGQSEMIQALGVHLTVAGEAYVTNRAKGDKWNVLASGKVTQSTGPKPVLKADFGEGGTPVTLGAEDLTMRIWTPHPRDPSRPDSPVRANLSTLAQIIAYDAHIAAQIQSRLSGAGILFMSNEVQFPVPEGMDPAASQAEIFMALIGEAMMTAKAEPSSPAATVPIVAMVPTESLGKNDHMEFWSALDEKVIEMRDAAIKRLALGLDVPPEVLLGIADANHWNAWLSEESAVKAHLEPRLAIIAYALSTDYLRPSLEGLVPNPDDYFVIADTSSIRLRPNRSQEAIELYNLGELSGPALRRETGFQPEDAPADEQVKTWILRKLATGSTSPEQTMAALQMLGVNLPLVPELGGENKPPPDHIRIGTEPELDVRAIPAREAAEDRARNAPEGLSAACDALVYRALERAGNRLKNAHPRTDCSAMQATDVYKTLAGEPDKLLAGAWDCAPDVLGPYADDISEVVATLDFYVRGLLSSHRPHSAVVLGSLLSSRPKAVA
jgi:hypothetical protein